MGYLICKNCGGYYELQRGESPDEFNRCDCGGELKYVESLDDAVEESGFHEDVKMCYRCGARNYSSSGFCSECGIRLKSVKHNNRNSTWNRQSSGVKALIIIAIVAVVGFMSAPFIVTGYIMSQVPYDSVSSDPLQYTKQMKLEEVNRVFTGPLITDPIAVTLKSKINNAKTSEELMAIDVFDPATKAWRTYQNNQINAKKDHYGKVRVTFTNGDSEIWTVSYAHKFVNERYFNALSNMEVTTP